MLRERLNGLAMCNIEKDVLDNIDPDAVLEDLHQEMADDGFFKRH